MRQVRGSSQPWSAKLLDEQRMDWLEGKGLRWPTVFGAVQKWGMQQLPLVPAVGKIVMNQGMPIFRQIHLKKVNNYIIYDIYVYIESSYIRLR